MKRFKQHIAETQDKPYPFKLDYKTSSTYKYVFTTDQDDFVDVDFYNEDLDYEYDLPDDEEESGWEVSFEINGSTGLTGGGDAFRVFSTVGAVLKDFMKKESPTKLMFTGAKNKDDDRTKLYTRFVKMIARQYKMKFSTKIWQGNKLKSTVFVLTK